MRFFEGAIKFLPDLKPYWLSENGTGESKGMKFAVFTARGNIKNPVQRQCRVLPPLQQKTTFSFAIMPAHLQRAPATAFLPKPRRRTAWRHKKDRSKGYSKRTGWQSHNTPASPPGSSGRWEGRCPRPRRQDCSRQRKARLQPLTFP